jgi:hypothetical protein
MTEKPDAKTILTAIGEPAAFGGNPDHWDKAMAAMPARLPILDAATMPARCAAAGLSADHVPLLTKVAAVVAADPALSAYAWYMHWRLFVAPENGAPWGPPSLVTRLGDQAGLFYLLLALDFAPALSARHRVLGYPDSVTTQTLMQIASYESNHLRGEGKPGLYGNQIAWLTTYLVDCYVRLGRLEYQLHPYGGGVAVWKRASDGQVLALAEAGTRVADTGARLDAKAPPEQGWTATLEETPGAVTGYPIDPEGRIIRKAVRLDLKAWSSCLKKGDTVLDLHIPAGGGMDWAAVTDSFRQALDFFARHHPDRPFAALTCSTWFMDPQLADLLPREANPLKLQRAVHLYPVCWGNGGLWFVFLRDMAAADPNTLPRDTSLRRALADFLKRGGKWNCGGMFMMPEDMANPRDGIYRERFQALRGEFGL